MKALIAALTVVMLLAGCGGLPTRTDVGRGLEIGGPPAPQWIDRRFDPPTPGMTVGEVVRNFVLESFASADNHSSSRNYLTAAAAQRWHPDVATAVFSSAEALTVKHIAPTVVEVSAPEVGHLDRLGRWVESAPGRRLMARFTVAKEAGEWRIHGYPPDFSTWMTDSDFRRGYLPLPLTYGVAEGAGSLVDYRWFPAGPRLATAVARALLGPVPEYLRGVARTGFPPSTLLAVGAVPVDAGQATMDVTDHLLRASPSDRALALAQAKASLLGVPGVSDVVVTAGGHRVEAPDVEREAVASALSVGRVESPASVLARRGGAVGVDFGERGDEVGRPGASTPPKSWATVPVSAGEVAIDVHMAGFAYTEGMSVIRVFRGARAAVRVPAVHLTRPTFDADGHVWVAGRDVRGRATVWRVVFPRQGPAQVVTVQTPWLHGGAISSLRMAWDGRRIVVGWTSRTGTVSMGLASWSAWGPQRDRVVMTAPTQVSASCSEIRDVRVVGPDSFAVIWRRGSDTKTSVSVVEASGATTTHPPLPGVTVATQVAFGRMMAVAEEKVFRLGTAWTEVGSASDLLVPGD